LALGIQEPIYFPFGMKIVNLSVFYLSILAFACSSKNNEKQITVSEIDSVHLVKASTKIFALDSATSYQTLFMSVYKDGINGKQYLLYENRIKSTIQFYDYNTGVLFKEIALKKEGPDGVGNIRGFYVKTMDSIYVMSSKSYQYILISGRGTVLKRYKLINGRNVNDWSMPAIYTSTPPILRDNKFYFVAYPESKPYEKNKPVLTLDLKDTTTSLLGNYPDVYQNGGYWGLFVIVAVSQTYTPQHTILYSFGADPYLYETDYGSLKKKHFAGSRYFNKTQPWDKKFSDGSEAGDVVTDGFKNILYDPYRKVYYRSTWLKLPELNSKNERNTLWNKPISVIILDKNFKKVGETLLEENLYDFRNWIVTEEGLLICNSNPNNPDIEESKLKFSVLKLVPQEE
jgi:hypothetical protein